MSADSIFAGAAVFQSFDQTTVRFSLSIAECHYYFSHIEGGLKVYRTTAFVNFLLHSMHVKMDSIARNALLYRLKKTSRAWAPWVSLKVYLKVYKKLKFSFIFNTKLPLHKKTRLTNPCMGGGSVKVIYL